MWNEEQLLNSQLLIENSNQEELDFIPYAGVTLVLSSVLLLSFFSGFKTFPVPFDLAWQFSPIGMLQGISPENRALESHGFFSGHFSYSIDYFIVFAKTCLFESPFYFLCYRRQSVSRFFFYLLFANFLTHPIIFFFIPTLFEKYITSAMVSEAFAPAVEMAFAWIILRKKEGASAAARGAFWILIANLFSWEVGMFL